MSADDERSDFLRRARIDPVPWIIVAATVGCGIALIATLDIRFAPAVVFAVVAVVAMAVESDLATARRQRSDAMRDDQYDNLARSLRHQRRRQDAIESAQVAMREQIASLATVADVKDTAAAAGGDVVTAVERTAGSTAKLVEKVARDQAGRVIKRTTLTSDHLYRQLEALPSLYAALDLDRGLPPLRSWAVSPDLGMYLVRYVLEHRPGLMVETGSGVSTLLMAMAAERVGSGRVVALEHDEGYAASTAALVEEYGMGHRVDIVAAPLVPVTLGGEPFHWYDTSHARFDTPIDLLLVDGPPGSIGPLSRFPAVPLLADHLADDVTVLLDDAKRDDERAVVERWVSEHGMEHLRTLRHEKGTAVLRPAAASDANGDAQADAQVDESSPGRSAEDDPVAD